MRVQFDQLSANQRYHLITQTITPRPIAWILTKNESASYNLAPFSYFAPVSSDPAILMVSIGNKSASVAKDTKYNLLREKECVLHIPSEEIMNAVNESSGSFAYGESEIPASGVTLAEFTATLPRISEAKVAMHCKLYDVHSLENASFSAVFLEVLDIYIDEDLVTQESSRIIVDNQKLNPLARLGGDDYALVGKTVTMKRPN
ncbi:MAG: flavin reductase family protein [Marinomonas foliarum]|jgi:flavin reductase (DIM6/NTAB) family NADH-FMN oxidoreductase RutF|uniref:Flavin reductase (DIM6/NTAB) family NADH-FMN oxidoreductase RutF n=1 Tax=Marinomonas foliarum TaxID=491950 RepID=A0A368ZM58_9GAMM|nr:flavin reductase family protein [Marinomonas foliarum]RCW95807.1 flavin reductase (DIM6/NTAB) family NADH-FMN oxidoreductase RutF [Marinomonas foliarum]